MRQQCAVVTVLAGWKAHRATYQQCTVDQSRQRTTTARRAGNAAGTAIAATQADRRAALSLATVTDQSASQPLDKEAASHITAILRESATSYTVRWSQPAGSPEVGASTAPT